MKRLTALAGIALALFLVASPLLAQDKVDKKAKAEVEAMSKALGTKMNFFESKYYVYASCKPEGAVRKLATTADKAFEVFNRDTKIKGWRHLWQDRKAMIVLLPNKAAYRRWVKWFAENNPVWDKEQFVKQHSKSKCFMHEIGSRQVIAMFFKPHDIDYLTQVAAHQTGFVGANRLEFRPNFIPPWLEEFTGAWVEAEATGNMMCSTTRDSYGATPFKADDGPRKAFKKFKKLAKAKFKQNNAKTVKGIMKPRLYELKLNDLYTGYVLIDWMRSQPGKYTKFVKAVRKHWPGAISSEFNKEKQAAQEKAFMEVFNMKLEQVDAALKKHANKI
jgi:hypothetical protein